MNRIAMVATAVAPGFGAPPPGPVGAHSPRPSVGFLSLMRRSPTTLTPGARDAVHPATATRPALPKASPSSGGTLSPAEASDEADRAAVKAEDDGETDPPTDRAHAALPRPDLNLAFAFSVLPSPAHPLLSPAGTTARAASSLEELLPALVRRVAWSGDRHHGSVRLEIGEGELDGATLLVHAEGGRVRVQLDVPPGVDARRWQQRIEERLAARGVAADAVEVT